MYICLLLANLIIRCPSSNGGIWYPTSLPSGGSAPSTFPVWKGESTLVVGLSLPEQTDEPIWQEEATIKIPQPTLTYCEDKCHNRTAGETTGTMIKSGNVCKCSYKSEKTNYNKCMSYCLDDERLEGADRDVCKYVDDICYTYKYIKVFVS